MDSLIAPRDIVMSFSDSGKAVLRLCSVKSGGRAAGRKLGNFYRQNEVHGNAKFFVSDLLSFSQAGRRGFDSRLPLHLFNDLHASTDYEHHLNTV